MKSAAKLSTGTQAYVGSVIAMGLLAVTASLYTLLREPVSYHWSLLAGLTLLSGSFTVRIPKIPARLSVSDTFVFAAVLLFGPAAATMIVVLDSLVISLWLGSKSQNLSRVLFNMAAPSVAIWLASNLFYLTADIQPLSHSTRPILPLIGPLALLALTYFLLNSVLVAVAVAAEKNVSTYQLWRTNFLWLSLNYFSGASVAALLLPYLQPEQPEFARVVGILLPLLLISYLTFKTAMGRVDDAHRHLVELNRLYLSTIETLAMAIDAKDQITHGHIRRVQIQTVKLAKSMGVKDENQIKAIEAAALLHDMGKLAVPEYILNKPGPLTPAEFDKIKLHASVGADILSAIDFPYPVVPIVRHHHENWDGSGYPDRIAGAAIPIGARILSVVDCFDALTSDRPYRPKLPDADAIRIVLERRGLMYDPLVVDTFIKEHAKDSLDVDSIDTNTAPAAEAPPTRRSARVTNHSLEEITFSGEEMLALFDLAQGLMGQGSVAVVADTTLKHLRRVVPASLSAFYLNDIGSGELVCALALGEHSELLTGLRIPLGQRLSGWVAAHRQTIRNSDPLLDLGESGRSITPRLRSCLSTPAISGDEVIGVLSTYSIAVDGFSEQHQRIIEGVGRQIAAAAKQARSTSVTGPAIQGVTDLRHSANPVTSSETLPVVLILVRLPLSGDISRSHQQDAPEALFAETASTIRSLARAADLFLPLQKEEFAVIQFESTLQMASSIADAIRRHVESASATVPDIPLEVRTAIASMPTDAADIEGLIAVARARVGSLGNRKQKPGAVH